MDPVSIFELTCTVLELSQKLYKFFQAIRDAPEEIRGYLSALEAVRRVFVDIQEYVQMYQLSAFVMEDGVRLRVIELALNDCEQEFALQLSFIEDSRPENASSFFAKAKKMVQWVFKKEIIEGLTKKLEKLQSLLSLAVATSTGKNDVLLQRRLEVVSSEVHHVSKTQEAEAAERQEFLLKLQQYVTQIQSGIGFFLQLARESNIRSDARLGDLTDSLAGDLVISTDVDPPQENGAAQDHGSLVQDTEGSVHPVGEQSGARHGSSFTQEAQSSTPDLPFVSQGPPPMTQVPAETLGCRPIIEGAFARYKENLDVSDKGLFEEGFHTWEDAQTQLLHKPTPLSRKVTKIALALVGNRSSATIDSITTSRPYMATVARGAAKLMLGAIERASSTDILIEVLTEMSDAITTCERELGLYKDPKIQDLVERLYSELLEVLHAGLEFYSNRRYLLRNQLGLQLGLQPTFEKSMAEVRRLSQAVLREVDYQHRLELRETSSRIVDMQIEQRKILTTLEDQKRILRSLQEERRIISVVQEQQKILQIVQQIQGTMQARGTSEQTRS